MGQKHDQYGKHLMTRACGRSYIARGPTVEVNLSAGRPARIDGTVDGAIAVEVESRVSKQVRGAVLDLVLHRYDKKLLLIMPVHMTDAEVTVAQCRSIMGRLLSATDFEVALLSGTGAYPNHAADVEIIRNALSKLGWSGTG